MGVQEGGHGELPRDGPLRWALADDWCSQAEEGEGPSKEKKRHMPAAWRQGERDGVQCPGPPGGQCSSKS